MYKQVVGFNKRVQECFNKLKVSNIIELKLICMNYKKWKTDMSLNHLQLKMKHNTRIIYKTYDECVKIPFQIKNI
jgi:hypothetical protein